MFCGSKRLMLTAAMLVGYDITRDQLLESSILPNTVGARLCLATCAGFATAVVSAVYSLSPLQGKMLSQRSLSLERGKRCDFNWLKF